MKVLVSTFGGEDQSKVLSAMKSLPYERLVLIGHDGARGCSGLRELMRLEEMAGHGLEFVQVEETGFMTTVDEISEVLGALSRDKTTGGRNQIVLNISGGPKLLGDAALFSAFRLGVEAYHCDDRVVRLPVLRGATAVDRFTEGQAKFMRVLVGGPMMLDALIDALRPAGRQSVERTLRQLRREGLVDATFKSGKAVISLSAEGFEAARALEMTGMGDHADRGA